MAYRKSSTPPCGCEAVTHADRPDEHVVHRCRLHDAAPELLAALQQAEAAIADWRTTGQPDLIVFTRLHDSARVAIAKATAP